MPTNPGLVTLFDGLTWMTRFSRRLDAMNENVDTSGYSGSYELIFEGEQGGTWHLVLDGPTLICKKGAADEPRGAVMLSVAEFFKLLAGQTAYSTAEMTGRVRVRGDGHVSFLFGALIAQIRHMRSRRGLIGWWVRRWTARALRRSDTGFEFKESAR